MTIKRDNLLKLYIVLLLYSSALKMVFGRWATLLSDAMLIVLIIYYLGSTGGKIQVLNKNRRWFALILIIQVIAIIEVLHPNITNKLYSIIEYRKSYFQMIVLLVFLMYLQHSKMQFSKWLRFIGLVSLPIILYGIKQYFWWSEIDNRFVDMTDSGFWTLRYGGHMRSVSIFSGPFHYGMFCVLIFCVFWYLFIEYKNKYYLVCSTIAVMGVYCSITRTNLVCLIVAVLVWVGEYYFYERGKNSNAIRHALIGFFLVLIALLILGSVIIQDNNNVFFSMINSLLNSSEDSRFTSRFYTWREASEYILNSPLFGWGMGSAGDTLSKYNISIVYVTSHSMYLKLMMELGIIGAGLYIWLFVGIPASLRRAFNYKVRTLLYSTLFCILLNGLMGATVATFPAIPLFWIIIACLMNEKSRLEGKEIEDGGLN